MEWELFGFELSVFDSVSSRKNNSVPRHALRKALFKATANGLGGGGGGGE